MSRPCPGGDMRGWGGPGKVDDMQERKGIITMKGAPMTLVGNEVKVGDKAPGFKAAGPDLLEFDFGRDCKGKVCVIAPVPSLDTSVCNMEARRFDKEAGRLAGKGDILLSALICPSP